MGEVVSYTKDGILALISSSILNEDSVSGAELNTALTNAVAALLGSVPSSLDTLNKLAAAMNYDANFANTIASAIAAGDFTTRAEIDALANRPGLDQNTAIPQTLVLDDVFTYSELTVDNVAWYQDPSPHELRIQADTNRALPRGSVGQVVGTMSQNGNDGIYVIVDVGQVGIRPWILERHPDYNTMAKMFKNMVFKVGSGRGTYTTIWDPEEPTQSINFSDYSYAMSALYAKGRFASAEGDMNAAIGSRSHAEGDGTIATGNGAHAEGTNTKATQNSHSEGGYTLASGSFSHVEGYYSQSTGANSHAEGMSSFSSGDQSHAEGSNTTASGNSSHTEGASSLGSGYASHAEGSSTIAQGANSHAEGSTSWAEGSESHAEGNTSRADGVSAHAEGHTTRAQGYASHAEGQVSHAQGTFGHAEGYFSHALGDCSHAEGSQTSADGNFSHAQNDQTTASGYASHAEGQLTIASGDHSHAEGGSSHAEGPFSHAEGGSSFLTPGSIQYVSQQLSRETFNDTSNTLHARGYGTAFPVHADRMYAVRALVVARRTDGLVGAAWTITAAVRTDASKICTVLGTPTITLLGADAAASTWTVAFSTATGFLRILSSGQAATSIRWAAKIEVEEVG